MNDIPSAEEFLQMHHQISHFYDDKTDKMVCFSDDVEKAMIEFAKIHREAILEAAADNAEIRLNEGGESGAVVFNINTYNRLEAIIGELQHIRQLQDSLIVFVLEEFDALLKYAGAESRLKNLLDCIDGVDDQLTLATTNYIQFIPDSLKDRKSRFKYVINLEMGNDKEKNEEWLAITITNIIGDITKDDLNHLISACHGRTIDDIKHICIDFKMGLDFLPSKKIIGFKKD